MNPYLKQKPAASDYAILFMNLIPLAGVWMFDWDPKQMFLIYCMESVLTGVVTIMKMGLLPLLQSDGNGNLQGKGRFGVSVGMILFFIFHFGIFVFVQLMIFLGVSNLMPNGNPLQLIRSLPTLLDSYSKILFLLFAGIYMLQMVIEFILKGGYKQTGNLQIMMSPYLRIFIQQFVVIIGGIFLSFGAGKLFMLIFVAVKLFFEVFVDYQRYLTEIATKQSAK